MITDSRRIAHVAFTHMEPVAGSTFRRLVFEGRTPCGNMVKMCVDLTEAEHVDLFELLFRKAQEWAEIQRRATEYLVPVAAERKAS